MLTWLARRVRRAFPARANQSGQRERDGPAWQKVFMSEDDLDPIAKFIRTNGITRCPTACLLPTQASILAADRAALEQHAVARDRMHREQAAARWGKFAPFKLSS